MPLFPDVYLRFRRDWERLDDECVLQQSVLIEDLVSPHDLGIRQSSLELNVRLHRELLSRFLEAPQVLELALYHRGKALFLGLLENVFSSREVCLEDIRYEALRVRFFVYSALRWFDFSPRTAFNPYQDLSTIGPLAICWPEEPSKSLLHRLWSFLEVPYPLDPRLRIMEKSFSFVLMPSQNVLEELQKLFWSLGRAIFIDEYGIFRSLELRLGSLPQDEELPLENVAWNIEWDKIRREFTDLEVEYASVAYAPTEILRSRKRAVHSQSGIGLDSEGRPVALVSILGETYYPPLSAHSQTWFKPRLDFIEDPYIVRVRSQGLLASSDTLEEDKSLVALWNPSIDWIEREDPQYEAGLECRYVAVEGNQLAVSFYNHIKRNEDFLQDSSIRDLMAFEVYSDVLFRERRHLLSTLEVHPEDSLGQRPTHRSQRFFLDYVNDPTSAQRFFQLHMNLIRHGHLVLRFSSSQNWSLGHFIRLHSAGQDLRLFIIQKRSILDSWNIDYIGLCDYAQKDYVFEEREEFVLGFSGLGRGLLQLSNFYDAQLSNFYTYYLNDENLLHHFSIQMAVQNMHAEFWHSIFFVGPLSFPTAVYGFEGASLRYRFLSPPTLRQGSSITLTPRRGCFVRSDHTGTLIEAARGADSAFKFV